MDLAAFRFRAKAATSLPRMYLTSANTLNGTTPRSSRRYACARLTSAARIRSRTAPLGFAPPPEEPSIEYDEEALRHFDQDE